MLHSHSNFGTAIQGIGGGGIINLSGIVIADLVSLAERGVYQGIMALTWAFACGIGPPIASDSLIVKISSSLNNSYREGPLLNARPGGGYSVSEATGY